ncbi:hypothetical protein AB1Y20_001848 [Prymnesium parvum]|uniref:WW domain-containing protein n=1 Tax=Prymnesium parvum TaxID=97485 RepID=A0AB34KCJ4_PRYPA
MMAAALVCVLPAFLLPSSPALRPLNDHAARRVTVNAGLFDLFKESEEKKAAKEAEWRAIQEKARLRRDPQAFAKYEEEVLARRLEQHKKRKEEEAFHLGANDIVIGSEEESTTPSPKVKLDGLPDGWKSAVDATTGNTYYFNKERGVTQWEKPK